MSSGESADDATPLSPLAPLAETPRALIVDDDPGFLMGLSEVVKREGFAVTSADTLKQAREELAAR